MTDDRPPEDADRIDPSVDSRCLDVAFDVLKNPICRRSLYYLTDQDGPVPLSDLVRAVTEQRTGPRSTAFLGPEFQEVAERFRAKCLPLLERHDVLEVDRDTSHVDLGESVGPIRRLLSATRRRESD